jgi:hypothetical protein
MYPRATGVGRTRRPWHLRFPRIIVGVNLDEGFGSGSQGAPELREVADLGVEHLRRHGPVSTSVAFATECGRSVEHHDEPFETGSGRRS